MNILTNDNSDNESFIDPQTIIDKMTSIGQLAMLSFATGAKHTLQLFHNVTNIHGNLVALEGTSNTSNAYIVDKTKLFKLRTKDLPDLDTIANLDPSRLSSKGLQKPNLVSTPIPATIVLPPFITAKIIATQAFSNAQHCFKVVWDLLITRDEADGITTFFPQDDDDVSNVDEDRPHINELTDDPLQSPRTPTAVKSVNPQSNLQRFEPLLLFLFAAADTHYGRSLKSSFQPNTDDDIEQWRQDRDDSITTTKKQATQNDTTNNDSPKLPSPTGPAPDISLTGKPHVSFHPTIQQNEDNQRNTLTIDTTLPNEIDVDETPQTTTPSSHPAMAPFNPPNNASQTQNPTPELPPGFPPPFSTNNTTPLPTDVGTMLGQMATHFLYSINKQNALTERFVDSFEASAKKRDDETTKIHKVTKRFILNASTSDGDSPAEDLTADATECMSAKSSVAVDIINGILHSGKSYAAITPKCIKALNTGQWTYPPGNPGNLCLFSLPPTANGTSYENTNISRILYDDENNRDITDADKDLLTKQTIVLPHTLHTLTKMCKTFSVLLDAFCGPDSIVATAAANVVEWLKTNEQELENVALHYDRRLPIKLAWFYSEAFNNFFNQAKHDVPSPSTLHFDSFHGQIKMGLSKIVQLPRSILDILDNNKKRNATPNGNGNAGVKREGRGNNDDNNKRQAIAITHENQPTKLKTAQDFRRKVLTPALRDKSIPKPMFNSSIQECINFCFKGECINKCERKEAHKPISNDNKRLDALLKFREQALTKYKREKSPSDPDFS
eukprot:g8886.t1 g8886   contig34:369079-371430(-)